MEMESIEVDVLRDAGIGILGFDKKTSGFFQLLLWDYSNHDGGDITIEHLAYFIDRDDYQIVMRSHKHYKKTYEDELNTVIDYIENLKIGLMETETITKTAEITDHEKLLVEQELFNFRLNHMSEIRSDCYKIARKEHPSDGQDRVRVSAANKDLEDMYIRIEIPNTAVVKDVTKKLKTHFANHAKYSGWDIYVLQPGQSVRKTGANFTAPNGSPRFLFVWLNIQEPSAEELLQKIRKIDGSDTTQTVTAPNADHAPLQTPVQQSSILAANEQDLGWKGDYVNAVREVLHQVNPLLGGGGIIHYELMDADTFKQFTVSVHKAAIIGLTSQEDNFNTVYDAIKDHFPNNIASFDRTQCFLKMDFSEATQGVTGHLSETVWTALQQKRETAVVELGSHMTNDQFDQFLFDIFNAYYYLKADEFFAGLRKKKRNGRLKDWNPTTVVLSMVDIPHAKKMHEFLKRLSIPTEEGRRRGEQPFSQTVIVPDVRYFAVLEDLRQEAEAKRSGNFAAGRSASQTGNAVTLMKSIESPEKVAVDAGSFFTDESLITLLKLWLDENIDNLGEIRRNVIHHKTKPLVTLNMYEVEHAGWIVEFLREQGLPKTSIQHTAGKKSVRITVLKDIVRLKDIDQFIEGDYIVPTETESKPEPAPKQELDQKEPVHADTAQDPAQEPKEAPSGASEESEQEPAVEPQAVDQSSGETETEDNLGSAGLVADPEIEAQPRESATLVNAGLVDELNQIMPPRQSQRPRWVRWLNNALSDTPHPGRYLEKKLRDRINNEAEFVSRQFEMSAVVTCYAIMEKRDAEEAMSHYHISDMGRWQSEGILYYVALPVTIEQLLTETLTATLYTGDSNTPVPALIGVFKSGGKATIELLLPDGMDDVFASHCITNFKELKNGRVITGTHREILQELRNYDRVVRYKIKPDEDMK